MVAASPQSHTLRIGALPPSSPPPAEVINKFWGEGEVEKQNKTKHRGGWGGVDGGWGEGSTHTMLQTLKVLQSGIPQIPQ
jgi:hypothetical protein